MLRRILAALALSTALTLGGTSAAEAAPVVGAVAAFAATPIGSFLVPLGLSFIVNEAKTLLQGWLGLGPTAPQPAGIRLTSGKTGVDPQAFLLGRSATGGTLNYWGTWGEDGQTPNAYLTQEIILSDVPVRRSAITGAIVGDKRIAIPDMSGTRPTLQGWPVPEFNDGKDNLWLAYRDGTQTTADSFLRSVFGSDGERPYTADMIGRGRAIMVVTMRVNETMYPGGKPEIVWESDGIDQYDPAKDSSRGGSGSHRADDPSTWEPSTNLAVCLHTALKGVYWGDEWVFGPQNTALEDLPASNWIAAINEADTAIPISAGGTEPQFAGGLEVTVDRQPADVIDDLLRGCAGKLAEIGGVYKPLLGAAPAAVYSFTDANILVTRERGLDPFPALDQTYNGGQGSYPEPAQGWRLKDAPAVYFPTLEAIDGGRRMAPSLVFNAVSSGTQVQRLLTGGVKDGRNFRRFTGVLPPEASDLEPLDTVAWTSSSEGFSSKVFLIDSLDDEPQYTVAVSLLETDPSAFDWDESTDEQPSSVGFLSGRRPPVQVITSPSVSAFAIPDDTGLPRRIGVRFGWDGTIDDVRAVGMQVRDGAGNVILSESTDNVAAGAAIFASAAFLPLTTYQGREIYYPRSARPTDWSDWLDFTTPDIATDIDDFNARTRALSQLFRDVAANVEDQLARLSQVIQDADSGHWQTLQEVRQQVGDAVASFTEQVSLIATDTAANAALIQSLSAALGGNTASINIYWEAAAAPEGYAARYVMRAEVNDGELRQASMFLDVPEDPDQPTRIGFSADQAVFFASDGTPINYINGDGEQVSANGAVYINWKTGVVRVTKVP